MKQKNFKQLHNRWLCWLGVCFLANLLLTHIAFPIGYLFSPAPIGYIDFMQHYSKAAAFNTMVKEHGIMWGYNPFYMAGTPEISDYDLDNKFVEIITLGLSYLKVSTIHSFKLIIFCEWLLGPFLVLMGFRNFGFSRRKSFWACLAAMMILNGPVGLFFNLGGMFSFVFATLFSFFTVSLFYRVFVNGADRKKILIIAATAWAPLLHSTSVFMVGIPAAIIILLKAGNLTRKNWLL
ncbi:MAG TPA: hypothetical protein VK186_14045, partial [Candidatus Deferrimicrobium sp.]|nr:hypothetical protein [Candidatus Deferrimicrobium sp.]